MNNIDCRQCTHSNVCKHRERMVEELRKFNETILEAPIKITISCDEYQEYKPIMRTPIRKEHWEIPSTGTPIEYPTYITTNTKPRGE